MSESVIASRLVVGVSVCCILEHLLYRCVLLVPPRGTKESMDGDYLLVIILEKSKILLDV
jgi:hypothetical protein